MDNKGQNAEYKTIDASDIFKGCGLTSDELNTHPHQYPEHEVNFSIQLCKKQYTGDTTTIHLHVEIETPDGEIDTEIYTHLRIKPNGCVVFHMLNDTATKTLHLNEFSPSLS